MNPSDRSSAPEALVLGGGVIGLTSALRLRDAGYAVRVWTAAHWPDTVSSVAAAIWYPYRAYPAEQVQGWARRAYDVFAELAEDPRCGVWMRSGRVLWREVSDDPGLDLVPSESVPILEAGELGGYRFGATVSVPIIEMPVYLEWLHGQLVAQGAVVERRAVGSVREALDHADLVVNCTGLGAREVAADASVLPIRGQVLRVENPGLERFTLDAGEHLREITYVIPRSRDVVLGGTAEDGEWSLEPDRATLQRVLQRCVALEPALAGARVLGPAVGLRPFRPAVRLELERVGSGTCIHNYGHGGSGVTVSWGCADEVVQLADQVLGRST